MLRPIHWGSRTADRICWEQRRTDLRGGIYNRCGFCMFASTANFHVSEMSTPSTLTFSLAFLSAIINLGQAFSPVVVNLISSMIGPDAGSRFIMAGIGSIAIAVLALLFVRNKSSHEEVRTAVVQEGN